MWNLGFTFRMPWKRKQSVPPGEMLPCGIENGSVWFDSSVSRQVKIVGGTETLVYAVLIPQPEPVNGQIPVIVYPLHSFLEDCEKSQ